jgi:hypothetical protein
VACGRRVLIAAAACDNAYGVAHSLQAAGIEVAAIARSPGRWPASWSPPPGSRRTGSSAVVAVHGSGAVTGASDQPRRAHVPRDRR